MKKKSNSKRDAGKRPYVGPQITILRPRGDQASKLADAIASGPPTKVEEIITTLDSEPKAKKKRA
ncbi:MAG TPA: hypothetical protein VMI10_13855 [Terriglobales bacterium]|nr:hypothetical protein [Terriglobales bacterium]